MTAPSNSVQTSSRSRRTIEPSNALSANASEINLWSIALREHYKRNSHHPEHFSDPSEMKDLDKKHMLCDLLASQLGSQWKHGSRDWTVPRAANVCRNWPKWKHVKDFYEGSFDPDANATQSLPRWPKNGEFAHEKTKLIAFVKCAFREKVSLEQFATGLYAFESVRYYLDDLMHHREAVVYVGRELFPDDEELMAALEKHDDDKWDALMIAAYVLKWIFDVERIDVENRFETQCFDSFLYFVVEEGKEEKKKMERI